jgi:replicative DNA helicase
VNDADYRALLHTPEELGQAHLAYAKSIIEHGGLEWPIPCMNRDLTLPLRPGTMATICGRPGHCKSTFLGLVGKYHARKIVEEGRQMDEAIVHITWEQSVEELEAFYQSDGEFTASDIAWGKVPLEVIERRAAHRQFLPVYMIGLSITRKHSGDLPRMFLNTVLKTVELLQRDNIQPRLLLMDYVQIIPVPHARDRVQQVTEVAPRVKEVAARIGAPALVAVQAAREVEERAWQVPQKRDSQWASSIEQAADTMFGIWRPSVDKPPGSHVETPTGRVSVTEHLTIIQRLKQRGEKPQALWFLHFNPATLEAVEMDLHNNP